MTSAIFNDRACACRTMSVLLLLVLILVAGDITQPGTILINDPLLQEISIALFPVWAYLNIQYLVIDGDTAQSTLDIMRFVCSPDRYRTMVKSWQTSLWSTFNSVIVISSGRGGRSIKKPVITMNTPLTLENSCRCMCPMSRTEQVSLVAFTQVHLELGLVWQRPESTT